MFGNILILTFVRIQAHAIHLFLVHSMLSKFVNNGIFIQGGETNHSGYVCTSHSFISLLPQSGVQETHCADFFDTGFA